MAQCAAAGDEASSPGLVYGAFSGTVQVGEADHSALCEHRQRQQEAAEQQQQQEEAAESEDGEERNGAGSKAAGGRGRARGRHKDASSAWDVALAHLGQQQEGQAAGSSDDEGAADDEGSESEWSGNSSGGSSSSDVEASEGLQDDDDAVAAAGASAEGDYGLSEEFAGEGEEQQGQQERSAQAGPSSSGRSEGAAPPDGSRPAKRRRLSRQGAGEQAGGSQPASQTDSDDEALVLSRRSRSTAAAAEAEQGDSHQAAGASEGRRRLVRRDGSRLSSGTSTLGQAGAGGGQAGGRGASHQQGQQQEAAEDPGITYQVGGCWSCGRRRARPRLAVAWQLAGCSSRSSCHSAAPALAPAQPRPALPLHLLCPQISEADLNGRGADPSAARVLVVCSKYETGYDDPRLTAMFVDRWGALAGSPAAALTAPARRRLDRGPAPHAPAAPARARRAMSGARALQTISRLNRPAPELGKRQAHVSVVDFANSVGAIREAFEEFFTETLLATGGWWLLLRVLAIGACL